MIKTKLTAAALAALAAVSLDAKIKLPAVIGDNMVLQQQTGAALWGKAEPGSKVTVRASWSKETISTVADGTGRWSATILTPEAGGPHTLTITDKSDGDKVTVKNILSGEVWFCSGQSNMEMPVRGFDNQPIEGSADVILGARPERPVRMCTVQDRVSYTPLDECTAEWVQNTPENVANTSATAYFFADYLQKILNVPVGIVISDWGGTPIEAWMDREAMSGFPEFDLNFLDNPSGDCQTWMPCSLYNGMVAPVIPFTVKGILWYQGENNRGRAEQYSRLLPAYVEMMREKWGNDSMPFYYVQIAPYNYAGPEDIQGALLREAQMKCLETIPYSGMAVTLDIGDYGCIHPAKKQEVGKRLACLALVNDYGITGINPCTPVYKSMEVNGSRAVLTFDAGFMGLAPLGHSLTGFEVAGADRKFYPAEARITGFDTVEVYCEAVQAPEAVRYCFKDDVQPSLYNGSGIPASSFRTDSW